MGIELSTRELVAIGSCELRSRLHRGELPLRHMGLGAKGALRYHAAVDAGDVVHDDEADRRAGVCAACEHRTDRAVSTARFDGRAHYCGEPFEDHERDGGPCGCLVGITVERERVPGGDGPIEVGHEPPTKWATGRGIVASLGCPLKRPRYGPAGAVGLG